MKTSLPTDKLVGIKANRMYFLPKTPNTVKIGTSQNNLESYLNKYKITSSENAFNVFLKNNPSIKEARNTLQKEIVKSLYK